MYIPRYKRELIAKRVATIIEIIILVITIFVINYNWYIGI